MKKFVCKTKSFTTFSIMLTAAYMFSFIHQTTAQCNNQIGELQVLNYQHEDGIFICYKDTLKVEIESYELMDRQQLYYIYHNGADVLNSTIIDIDTIKSEGIINNNQILNTYVTAIISKAKSFDLVLEDSCTIFSNTVAVTFLSRIASSSKIACNADMKYCIGLQIAGGLPKLDSLYSYITEGYIFDALSINEIGNYKLDLTPHDRLKLYISDANGCRDTLLSYVNACSLMPVELIAYNVEKVNNGHLIKWVMASQINVDHFLIEVSKNGGNFEVLDSIGGEGTTSQTKSYQFLNQNLIPGIYQYKLSTVSKDGIKWEVGTVELINYATNLHPNPTHSKLNFHFHQASLTNVKLRVFDLSGRILPIDESQIEINLYGFSIDVTTLSEGIYFVRIRTDELESIEKFVVEK